MSDFMGANTNVASYDQDYLEDLSKCVKWIREYHNWAHYESTNDYFKWDDFTQDQKGNNWPHHTKFIEKCNELGVNVLIDVLDLPEWIGKEDHIPNSSGDGSKATDYLERIEFVSQLVARYGSQKIDSSFLKTADKLSGLNYITYYEDDNEPDYWWWETKWPAEHYAKYCNAVHDGTGVQTNSKHPLLGIKTVDPNAKHVLAGLAKKDTVYLQKILDSSNGKVPFDVVNIHMYCTDDTNGYSPENEKYGFEKKLTPLLNWRDRTIPGMPFWMTEFGWDTYIDQNKQHSCTYIDFEQQANYLLRSYFILLKMGFEKAFMYMASDHNSHDTIKYASSGYFFDNRLAQKRKPSFYYQVLAQNILGSSIFKKVISFAEISGTNENYCFEFENSNKSEKIYVLWTRETNSSNDTGATSAYQLDLGFKPTSAYSVLPKDKHENGEKIDADINGKTINLKLTETPQFLIIYH
ncbi:hypothetical protein [Sunxiuqinia indica]|uniref:hypothetical protein n=1 Tax=Sunxiuqinia indica TaxID=2692584 RepID=UPI00135C1266|nr:hypothetical protein [Sunxiuqinia indica]